MNWFVWIWTIIGVGLGAYAWGLAVGWRRGRYDRYWTQPPRQA